MVDVRKVRGGKAQAAAARAAVRKALAFSPTPVATVSPASDEDIVSATSATFSSAFSAGNPEEVLASSEEEEEVGRSTSSLRCASPTPSSSIITTEVGSSSSAASRSTDAAVDTEPLMRACSAVASSSADCLSRKVAAALLKALEHEAAVAAGGGGREDVGRPDALSNRVEKVWIAVVCFGILSVLLALTALTMLASWSGRREDWSPYPPPT